MTPHNAYIRSIRDREFKAEMEFAAALLFSLIFDAGFGCAVRRGRRGCSGRVESCCGCVCEDSNKVPVTSIILVMYSTRAQLNTPHGAGTHPGDSLHRAPERGALVRGTRRALLRAG